MGIQLRRMQTDGTKPRANWPTTHWSLVGRVGTAIDKDRREAIVSIVRIYSPVLRRQLFNRWRLRHDQVDDLLHEFLLSKILSECILGLANPDRGRFRTFLATALDNFVRNWLRDRDRKKRGGHRNVQLDEGTDLVGSVVAPNDSFDYGWARQVIGQSVRRLRLHCEQANRPDIWGVFRGRILQPSLLGVPPSSYATLVGKFRLESTRRATNVLVTGVRLFKRSVYAVLGQYLSDGHEIDEELHDLWQAVSKAKSHGIATQCRH
jgi:DNA-directed RNA polymerase specialized sigma24 family protein